MRAAGSASGFIKLRVFCVPPETSPPCTPGDGQEEEDIAIDTFQSDVQCRAVSATNGCGAAGADYTGGLLGVSTIRITDHSGGGLACTNNTGAAPCVVVTTINTDFAVPTNGTTDPSPCAATPASPAGSTCNFSSTINSQVPGAVKERQAGVVSVFGLQVRDRGPDGSLGAGCPPVCGTNDERTFVDQGIFLQ
jgi:hypothetical protein